MCLSHVVSVYQLLVVILYILKYKKNEQTILVIRDLLFNNLSNPETLSEIFSKIIIYKDIWKAPTEKEEEKEINNYFDELFKNNNVFFNDVEEIICGCCQNTFGIYLTMNNYHYIFLEDAAGRLSRTQQLDTMYKNQYDLRYKLIKKYGLLDGDNECTIAFLIDKKAQEKDYIYNDSKKYIDLCVEEELIILDDIYRKKILSIFSEIRELNITKDSVIVLTQHLANCLVLTYSEQIYIYELFVDYIINNHSVVIKRHPSDLIPYILFIKNGTIIDSKFPAEFLPFLFDNKPLAIATISSTSCNTLRNSFDNVIQMGELFEKQFKKIHKYFIVKKFIDYIDDSNNKIGCFGCNDGILKNFEWDKESGLLFFENTISKIVLVDDYQIDDIEQILDTSEVIILLNNSNIKYYQRGKVFCIKKKQIRFDEYFVADEEDEYFCVICKDKEKSDMIKNFKCQYELDNTGLQLTVKACNKYEEKIMCLEGKIDSLETEIKKIKSKEEINLDMEEHE